MGCGQSDRRAALDLGTPAKGCRRHPSAVRPEGRRPFCWWCCCAAWWAAFRKAPELPPRFLTMAGTLAITALTAGSLDTLMGSGTAAMEQMNTFSKALLPTLAAVSALSGGVAGATLRQIATVFFADLLLELIHGLLMPMVYLYAGTLAAGGQPVGQAAAGRGGDDPDHLRLAADNGAAALYAVSHCQRYFCRYGGQRHGYGWQRPPFPAWCRWWEALSPRRRKPCWPVRAC